MKTAALTEEQRVKIAAINDSFEKSMERINESRRYRMENYYNCIDDYSYGGLCDKADDEAQRKLEVARDLRIEKVKNGKIIKNTSHWVLEDLNGNVVSHRPFEGKFGWCFFDGVNNKWVSMAKRQETFLKKGYRMVRVDVTFECDFAGEFLKNGGVKWTKCERVRERRVEDCKFNCGEQWVYETYCYSEDFLKELKARNN